jgi:hypothetical protein
VAFGGQNSELKEKRILKIIGSKQERDGNVAFRGQNSELKEKRRLKVIGSKQERDVNVAFRGGSSCTFNGVTDIVPPTLSLNFCR